MNRNREKLFKFWPKNSRLALNDLDGRISEATKILFKAIDELKIKIEGLKQHLYLGEGLILTRLKENQPFILNFPDEGCALGILVNAEWEPELTKFLKSILKPNSNILDVGANLGYYPVVIGTSSDFTGTIHCFEPHPNLYSILQKNIIINRLEDKVSIHNIAASNHSGDQIFTYPNHHKGQGGYQTGHIGEQIRVKTDKIDNLLQGFPRVDLVKIDVEGMELEVLLGMENLISRSPDLTIVAEKNRDLSFEKTSELWNIFESQNFKIYNLPEFGDTFRLLEQAEFDGYVGMYISTKNPAIIPESLTP